MTTPLNFRWDGAAMRPLSPDAAAAEYQAGKTYRLAEWNDRSGKSHRHYFACIRSAWRNLPENLAQRFPSEEHLRRHALIETGYVTQRVIVAQNPEHATRVVAFAHEYSDGHAVCDVQGNVVTIWMAQSQSARDMSAADFAQSKEAVLGYLAHLLGITVAELADNAVEV